MNYYKKASQLNRRKFLQKASALGIISMLPGSMYSSNTTLSKKLGVNLGVITYSFRSMPGSAEELLAYMAELGLNSTELMGDPAEAFAGAPIRPKVKNWRKQTDKEKESMQAWQKALHNWRMNAPMEKFKDLRKMYTKEGVAIDIVKFNLARMDDDEVNYAFKAAKALGAKGITLERSDAAMQRLAPFASEHKLNIGYHNHAKVDFESWDKGLELSDFNAVNLDIGHYVAGTNESPIPLIKKYHNRITNLHLKDRKKDNGPNMPWGEGDTPIGEVMRLLRDEKYDFLAAIELEYKIPKGSDAVKEVKNCIDFVKDALA
ncbi:MAG: sugar phosphate isomerase/epimerase [Bacteroidia bacterium]|nr:sugar phosphate isomerase/epimerase [Bacteroidia bacterium]